MIRIRTAEASDVQALTDILREPGLFPRISKEPKEETLQRVEKHLSLSLADSSHTIYIAENDRQQVIGYTAVHWLPYLFLKGPEGYVSELFVRDSARGEGAGTQLMEAVKAEAVKRGCSRLMVVNIRSRASYSRGFYSKLGWKEREEAANFVYLLPE